jgi:hypothetical protein
MLWLLLRLRVTRRGFLGYGFVSLNPITVAWGCDSGEKAVRAGSNEIVVIIIRSHAGMSMDPYLYSVLEP